jgi:hypothetical protein
MREMIFDALETLDLVLVEFEVPKTASLLTGEGMAEGEGFEPPLPVRVKRFSRPPVSTAHTSLRMSGINSLPALKAPQACGLKDRLFRPDIDAPWASRISI